MTKGDISSSGRSAAGQPKSRPQSSLRSEPKNMHQYISMLLTCFIIGISVQPINAETSCLTPEHTAGQCVPYQECPHIMEKLNSCSPKLPKVLTEYVRKSRCVGSNSASYYICCDLSTPTTKSVSSNVATGGSQYVFTRSGDNYEASLDPAGVKILNALTCGVSQHKYVSKGEETRIGEFPWMALLRYDDPNKPFQCGGSLITDRFVLTATHCINGPQRNVIAVRLGEHDIQSEIDCEPRGKGKFCAEPAEEYGVAAVITHPEYNRELTVNDVGLIKLDRAVKFKRNIKPICLPLTKIAALAPNYPEYYFIGGWGKINMDDQATRLQKAKLLSRPIDCCQAIFRNNPLTDRHICAGGVNSVDSCRGDSGGPLFAIVPYMKGSVRYVQYGVVSFGAAECGATASYPGVYTNVIQFMGWITKQILN